MAVDVSVFQVDTVAFGRLQMELGVQISNSIIQQVQIERQEQKIKDLMDHIKALSERCARLDADNDKMRSERSPAHAKMREVQGRMRERELARQAEEAANQTPSTDFILIPDAK